jgi:hypothetical protein
LKLVLFSLAKGLAFAVGAGFLGFGWLLGTAVIDYVTAIFSEGDKAPSGDYRNLSDADFGKSENNIKMATVRKTAFSALAFGAGYLALTLGIFD